MCSRLGEQMDGWQWVKYRSDFSINLISRALTFSGKLVLAAATDFADNRIDSLITKTYCMEAKLSSVLLHEPNTICLIN